MLTPGTYKLRTDVINPSPDRRSNQSRLTNWHKWTIWPAGTIFIVAQHYEHAGMMVAHARGGFEMDGLRSGVDPVFDTLTAALEPVPESPSDYLERVSSGSAGRHALAILYRLNIPLTEIERMLAEMDAEEEARECGETLDPIISEDDAAKLLTVGLAAARRLAGGAGEEDRS